MFNPVILTKALTAASTVAVASSQTLTSGTALTLVSATVTLDTQRRILSTFGAQTTSGVLYFKGSNQDGAPISETVLVPASSGTVATVQDFLTVTAITPFSTGTFGAFIAVGTNTTGSTPWKFMSGFVSPMNLSVASYTNGTVTYNAEYTLDMPNAVGITPGVIPSPIPFPNINGSTSYAEDSLNWPVNCWRLTVTAGTATVTMTGFEAGVLQ